MCSIRILRCPSYLGRSKSSDSEQKMNLNVTWSRRWRQRDAASSRRRRRGCQRVYAAQYREGIVPRRTQELEYKQKKS